MRSGPGLRVEVLGPLRVVDRDGVDVTPGGQLPRRLLALLVLRRGRPLSVDHAIDALWPIDPPANPNAALQNHVSRLRRDLGADLIRSAPDGYRLDPTAVEVDADALVGALAAATPDASALPAIDGLLERWAGPAFQELDDVDEARVEAQRLEELRVRAREVRAEVRLLTGETDGLIAELTALADEQPLREHPRSLLMDALTLGGRRADALRVFDDFRRLLGDELGIEPSPLLSARQRKVLDGTSASPSVATRLPAPATSLIGRDALVAGAAELVADDRLVTLVGPGGVGKTRLLLEVGRLLLDTRAERPVVLCELAMADVDSAVDVVAAALGIDVRPGVPLVERVATVLGDSALALLLDNCEHVLDPVAALVEGLLARCPAVRVVATSRERLRVAGEHLLVVPPLAASDEASPAVELFLERARSVDVGFAPDPQELALVEQIVRRLDGLPLAIELAAARLYTHTLPELAAGLEERFDLLSMGYRTSTRHGSLAAAVSWSFQLLDDDLQRCFADVSVFSGSFGSADAAAVCGVDEATATDWLARLAERSLVTRGADRRFAMLETLRAYGAEQLTASGRRRDVQGRHAHHLVKWIEAANLRLAEPGSGAITAIDDAVIELRHALGWLLDDGDVDRAGRMVASLLDYCYFRLRVDVLQWAELVADADPEGAATDASSVWVAAAYGAWMAGDVAETGSRAARALATAEAAGGPIPPAVMMILGAHALFEGRLDESTDWCRRGADAADAGSPTYRLIPAGTEILARGYAGDPSATVLAERLLAEIGDVASPYAAYLWYCAGESDLTVDANRARLRFERALELAATTGASFVAGLAGASKASIDARLGDPVAAARDYQDLIRHWRRAGMWSTQWTMLRSIVGLLERLGRPVEAAVLGAAVRATTEGHRIFGADEVALDQLAGRLRRTLGDTAYADAQHRGAALDRDAAVELALRAL